MMENFTIHKGPLSEIKNVAKGVYICGEGHIGDMIKRVEPEGVVYDLYIATSTETAKLTTIMSSLWEMRRDLVKENVKRVAIEKSHHLHGNLSWDDIKKCLVDIFKGTNIKVTLCEF